MADVTTVRPHGRGAPRLLGPLLALFALLAFLAPSAALAAASGGIGVQPANEPNFFHLHVLPGETVTSTAILSNTSNQAEHILVYPVDAEISAQGGFAPAPQVAPRTGVGAWTKLPLSEATLAPKSQQGFSFTIPVPPGNRPGDYAGAIIAQRDVVEGKPSETRPGYPVQINTIDRVGARIYLRVDGTAAPSMTASPPTLTDATGGAKTISVRVLNTGNLTLKTGGSITFSGVRMPKDTLPLTTANELLPGQSATVATTWKTIPTLAWGKIQAKITYDGGGATSSTSVRFIPWLWILIAVAVLLALITGLFFFIRFVRRARRALRGVPAVPPPAPRQVPPVSPQFQPPAAQPSPPTQEAPGPPPRKA